jgi:hypothetical protein
MQAFINMLVAAILKYLFGIAEREIKDKIDIAKEHVDEKKQAEEYDKVVKNPESTRAEREKAESDLLNGL